jgi:aspartyl-tRNA(Asn)/glutamyl-tRNA(Gln) amidotransferase subunit A
MAEDAEAGFWSIGELHRQFTSRALSPVEVTAIYLDRIEATHDELHAFLLVTSELAFRQSRASEQRYVDGAPLGVLDGIPLAVKDVYDTKGIRTTAQSALFADRVPRVDAAVVERLASHGSVLLGKLALTEFGAGVAGPTDVPPPARNPWDVRLSPGGSSSGPAVAVAAGLCAGALGTDAGGSIREPASACGVVGLKPTFGLVSRRGCIQLAETLDHCGPLTRSVKDAAIVLDAIAGFDPGDAGSAEVATPSVVELLDQSPLGFKVGVPASLIEAAGGIDAEVRDAFDAALNTLQASGAHVVEVALPDIEYEPAVFATILNFEAFAFHRSDAIAHPELYGRSFFKRLVAGSMFSAADYAQALRGRSLVRAGLERTMQTVDVLALPTRPRPAQPFGTETGGWARPSLRHPFNVTGQPAISVPCGFSGDGLPIGLQLVGRWFEEPQLLAFAHAYEQAHDWSSRRPG